MPCQRILHVVFSSHLAGSERYCVDLANRQAAAGHEVHVAGKRGSPIKGALSSAVRYHTVGWFLRGLRLRMLVSRLAPDICHGHLSAACKSLGGISSTQNTIATLHVGYKAHQHAGLGGLICVNHAQAGRLAGYRGLSRVVPNWMPQAPIGIMEGGIREELGLAKDVFLVGAVGRLHPSKGMDVLVAAFRTSATDRSALVILGDGPQRSQLERLAAGDPRIHFLGHRSVVQPVLRELDLFVSPSREESFGLAIIEAMEAGAPIVATAAEGPAEFLADQPVSLVAPGSSSELATALRVAHGKFLTGNLRRIEYDLSFCNPTARLSNIMEFYGQVMESTQWSAAKQERPNVALAT